MKSRLLFLVSLFLIIAGCNEKELGNVSTDDQNTESQKIRWYGVKLADEVQTKGVADGAKRWNQDAGIYIKFLNTPSDPQMVDRIKTIAAEWEQYAGIRFHFVEGTQNAQVRIAFDWNGNDWLTWSYTGTDARTITNQNEPTAIFGGLEYLDEEEFKGDVLRLFGQILGLEYEQRHQQWASWRSETAVEDYWRSEFGDFFGDEWDWDEVREYVFTPLSTQNAYQPLQTENIDEESIMAWPYYQLRRQVTKLLANFELSEGDKAFIAQLYPPQVVDNNNIQNLWVDAGYFTWKDATKTSLQITELGRQQEYLPDVSDGEQLVTARSLFANASQLKRAPEFNTCNITDFCLMFQNCASLTNIPHLETSNGTCFGAMFDGCLSLTTVPQLNTSKGTSFDSMFKKCKTLTSIPELNTYNGSSFFEMFNECKSLTSIPNLETSNGFDFGLMFANCDALINIPYLDVSNGLNFEYMFTDCVSLQNVPLLNTSQGENFQGMFNNCTSLTYIPEFDTSQGENFQGMFRQCFSLISIPQLNTSNGISFNDMFGFCLSLKSIPALNTLNGRDFNSMFYSCISLSSIPLLNTSNGTNFSHMFAYCEVLTTIPNLNTSNGTDFSGMFDRCSSLTNIPNLNTSNGKDFSFMFYCCRSLRSMPQLDLSSATTTTGMYSGTPFG